MAVLAAGPLLANSDSGLKLRVLGGRPVVDGVMVNGNGPYRFLIDTGAETNQLDRRIAAKIGLTPTFQVELATAAGVARVGGGKQSEIALGSAHAANQELLFTSLDGVHALSSDIQGVLGQEFLSHFDYRLDLKAKTIDFNPADPSGAHIPTARIAGRLAIETSLGRLVLDSGSDTLVLFHSAGKGSAVTGIRTASGFAAVEAVSGLRVRIGDRDYRPGQSAVVPQPGAAEDGLMPASLFQSVYVSNSQNYVILQ
jgi:hypothetical protein